MDSSETAALEFLKRFGNWEIEFEPFGQDGPDFTLNRIVGVEVTRMGKHILLPNDCTEAIEEKSISVLNSLMNICSQVPKRSRERGWLLELELKRPIEYQNAEKAEIRRILSRIELKKLSEKQVIWNCGGVQLAALEQSDSVVQKFEICTVLDRDVGGWVGADLMENLPRVVDGKIAKTNRRKKLCKSWWLVVIDTIAFGRAENYLESLGCLVQDRGPFDRIFLVNPVRPNNYTELI